ncbi:hypothetical protein [Pseudonocardia sp. TRM90224]|uniref:hypothetical protein n=1 Tax=Pseudonocardia sp. TRM90224 TaxID=2812678 RepID=UPI001E48DA41|nr:hypothetical protein [Pseudonocardia sp. TRM90224]
MTGPLPAVRHVVVVPSAWAMRNILPPTDCGAPGRAPMRLTVGRRTFTAVSAGSHATHEDKIAYQKYMSNAGLIHIELK